MGIKIVKPTSSGRRSATFDDFLDITKTEPEPSLITIKKPQAGRNNTGKITVRHQGGGVKRYLRQIDFKRDKFDIPGKVMSIEYDPNRGARIGLVYYKDGEKRYIIMPLGLNVGEEILSSKNKIEIKTGNAMPIKFIPAGIQVYNLELEPGRGARVARAAGNLASVMGVEGDYAQIKMPSSEIRLVNKECLCTIGQVSNPDRNHIVIGRAGRQRLLGVRPTVRGTAMNPVDHPHGGGEGKQSIGLRHPKTKWGKPALGVKTRDHKKRSNRLIISRRVK
ncbi:MAG: 50S ribosomal protein L2 [Patescibacteria group bacterium]|nr:50S ribosomal protein L2 [Patescibacteria group bacterium]